MKILFDSALDGRAWPLYPNKEKALLGEIQVGQLGMLGLLETMLGLRGPSMPEGVRIASLIPSLNLNKDAFWSRSATVDPFGVARELLRLHDFLVLHGWQGQPLTPRLKDLSSLSAQMLPSIPQRLIAVLAGLADYDGSLPSITLMESIGELPLLWQKVFDLLKKQGAPCQFKELARSLDHLSDLGSAQKSNFSPTGDASLQLIRPGGVLQAAEEVAAWLAKIAEDEGLEDTVIIGADPVLDDALHRFGLPVSGSTPESGHSLLQLLPLVLSIGWNPPDPARIMELLTLPISPVPSNISRKLIDALSKWPAMGSELWQKGLDGGLEELKDQVKSDRVKKRLQILFHSTVKGNYPVSEIKQRVDMHIQWLRGRFQDDALAYPALNQCQIFWSMVTALGRESLTEPLMKRILDETISAVDIQPILQAQAGLAMVTHPEAIIGTAKRIVWWNFNRNTVRPLAGPLLSTAEKTALAEAGVILPDSALQANARAVRWRRPLTFTEQQLILICPARDAAGNELHPHPLWDELLATSEDKANKLITTKIVHSLVLPSITPKQLTIPQPQTSWKITAGSIKPREKESPSSLDNFLGCPLKWSINYTGKIRSGHSATLPDLVPTLGSLAHEIVEEVLQQIPLPSADDGAILAGELFNQRAPQLVATLYQDGMEAKKEEIYNTVVMATRSLLQHLHDAGVGRIAVEQQLSGVFGSQKLEGRADVVLDRPFTVIDLKRSWAKGYKEKMKSGTALQIVIYGWLLKETRGVFPELAYYTLEDQTFLTTDSRHFANGVKVQTPSNDEVWKAFENTYNEAWKVLNSGLVRCPGNGDEVKAKLDGDSLILETPCRFCDYDVLCGKRFS
jgi:ATP-dependent helicase/nuclease subunit B